VLATDQILAEVRTARRALRPVDRLLLAALAALGVVALSYHTRPGPFVLLFGLLGLFLAGCAALASSSRVAEVLHAFGPLVVVVGIFEAVGELVAATTSRRWDGYFAALDARLFGALVPAWRGALGRPDWLTDLLSLAYVSYYVVPLVMGIVLYRRRRREEFDALVLALQVTLLASYAGYFAFPTSGPRVPAEQAQAVLGGGALSAGVRLFLRSCELNSLDAFPSGHTAVSLVFLALGWRAFPAWRAPLALVVAAIVFSTVYLSHHYVIDLVAGAALAAGVLAALALQPGASRDAAPAAH
jgi:membrane-associated phospholipid phosphatase